MTPPRGITPRPTQGLGLEGKGEGKKPTRGVSRGRPKEITPWVGGRAGGGGRDRCSGTLPKGRCKIGPDRCSGTLPKGRCKIGATIGANFTPPFWKGPQQRSGLILLILAKIYVKTNENNRFCFVFVSTGWGLEGERGGERTHQVCLTGKTQRGPLGGGGGCPRGG